MAACVMPRGLTCCRAQRAFLCKYLKYLAELTKKTQLGSIQCLSVIWMSGAITDILGMMDMPGCTLWGCDCPLGLTRSTQVSGRVCVCLSVQPPIHWVFLLVSAISVVPQSQAAAPSPAACQLLAGGCCRTSAQRWAGFFPWQHLLEQTDHVTCIF